MIVRLFLSLLIITSSFNIGFSQTKNVRKPIPASTHRYTCYYGQGNAIHVLKDSDFSEQYDAIIQGRLASDVTLTPYGWGQTNVTAKSGTIIRFHLCGPGAEIKDAARGTLRWFTTKWNISTLRYYGSEHKGSADVITIPAGSVVFLQVYGQESTALVTGVKLSKDATFHGKKFKQGAEVNFDINSGEAY